MTVELCDKVFFGIVRPEGIEVLARIGRKFAQIIFQSFAIPKV